VDLVVPVLLVDHLRGIIKNRPTRFAQNCLGRKKYKKEAMKLTFEEAVAEIKKEREHQQNKYGELDKEKQTIRGFLNIIEGELEEAKEGLRSKRSGRDSALGEIRQIAAVATACMQLHGVEGNEDGDKNRV